MKKLPALLTLIFVPLYIIGAFATYVFAPEGTYTTTDTEEEAIQLVFLGDMMFDRYVRARAKEHGYVAVFGDTPTLFADSDMVVGNLEGPITSSLSISDWKDTGPSHYTFTFATTVASSMQAVGVNTVTLANNHILNFGESGYVETKDWLTKHDIAYFGAPDSPYDPVRKTLGGTQVVMYAFDTWYARDINTLIAKIEQEAEDSFVVVYAHWGDEYESDPNSGQREYAKRFVDAGVDFVVGSHPHVVQAKEKYKDVWIYYSLGNFIFDQYFSDEVSCGAVVQIDVEADGTYVPTESFISLERNGTTKVSDCLETVPIVSG